MDEIILLVIRSKNIELDPNLLDHIIYETLKTQYPKGIHNIVSRLSRVYKVDLDARDRQRLARIIQNRLNKMVQENKVRKLDEGFVRIL